MHVYMCGGEKKKKKDRLLLLFSSALLNSKMEFYIKWEWMQLGDFAVDHLLQNSLFAVSCHKSLMH